MASGVSITMLGRKRNSSMTDSGSASSSARSADVVITKSGQQSWCVPIGDSRVATSGGKTEKSGRGSSSSRPKILRSSNITSSLSAEPRRKCSTALSTGSDSKVTERPSAADNTSSIFGESLLTFSPLGNVMMTTELSAASRCAAHCISSPIFLAPRIPPRSLSRIAQCRSPIIPSCDTETDSVRAPIIDFTG